MNSARIILAAGALLVFHCATTGSDADLARRIERVENGLLPPIVIKGQPDAPMSLRDRMAFYKTPGVSVAIINNGVVEWARGYGVREGGAHDPVTVHTIFQAASISKPVAAAGALLLAERGTLELDSDVNRKLISWKVSENEDTREEKVTLRRALSHTAGLAVHGYRGYSEDESLPTLVQVLEGTKPANSAPTRADIVPGSQWRYAGGGYSVVQQLMIDVTGKSFPTLMRETVLRKVGMSDSTFDQPLGGRWRGRAAAGHQSDGTVIKGKWHTYPEMAAAGLWTTPADLARFAIALQQNRLLAPDTARIMLTPGLGDWGLGLGMKGTGPASRFSHGGSNEGFRASLVAYRESGQGAVVMTNSDNGGALAQEILFGIAKEYGWSDFAPKEKTIATVDPGVYDIYAGVYEVSPNLAVTVTREKQTLIAEAQGQRYELLPESETNFFTLKGVEVRFVKDAAGEVTHLVLPGGTSAKKVR